jgi:hypothetical protein
MTLLDSKGSVKSNILTGLMNSNDKVIIALQVCSSFDIFTSLCFQML